MINEQPTSVFGQLGLPERNPDLGDLKLNRAIAGFLAAYSGPTLTAYRLDLRQWIGWLGEFNTDPFVVERAHIELFARTCEEQGKARSTIGRHLSTICGFYRYCEQERLIERDPGAHVRRPKQDYESTTLGLDRNELGAFLVQAGLSGGRDHALASLLALNGLRISEALGADIGDLEYNRGHRTLFIHRKGNKTAIIPLAPRTSRSLDLYIGEREGGPIFLNADGTNGLIVTPPPGLFVGSRRRLASTNGSHLTHCDTPSSPPPWTPACLCETCKRPRRTLIHARPCGMTEAEDPSTGTPPTSCQPSSPEPVADNMGAAGPRPGRRHQSDIAGYRSGRMLRGAANIGRVDWLAGATSLVAVGLSRLQSGRRLRRVGFKSILGLGCR